MKTYKREFKATDAVDIQLRAMDRKDLEGVNLYELGLGLEKSAYAMTVVREDGVIIGCGGIMYQGYRCAEAWALTSDLVPEYPMQCLHLTRVIMRKALKELKLVRLEARVLTENKVSVKMLETMGFLCEGFSRKTPPNFKDRYTFAKVV
ncbi:MULTISPECIES: hypothetical protein [unclassified Maridesulfovibrio]|uniref:GNAT family N-acetyltransferase n=1 Tax=unclassified Maridesulfovibrio TaxID=2794999 RepID=UPI002A189D00|nr:hypothetical protein [Maridesulfovibrio sp.]